MTWLSLSLRVRYRTFLLAALMLQAAAAIVATAQDSHYWTNQYGTESWLLGGAVVGASADLASTFYNPASIAVRVDTSSLLTAVTLNWSQTKLEPKNIDFSLRSSGTSPLPGLVSVNLPLSLLGSRALQISYLQRTHVRSDLYGTGGELGQVDTQYVATGQVYRQLFDSWFGITWSKAIVGRHSLGVTTYLSVVASEYSTVIGTTVTAPGTSQASTFSERTDYDNFRLLAKVGYYFDGRPFSFGLTFTTPSVKLFNTYGSSSITQGIYQDDSILVLYNNAQGGLSSQYRTPMSVAFGGTWYGKLTSVYVTVEWFDGLDSYRPLEPASFTTTIPGDVIESYGNVVTRYGIVNLSVGVKHQVADHTFLYASVFRDGSSVKSGDSNGDAVVNYDLYHGTIGWQFMIDQTTITLGGILGGGWVNNAPPAEFARIDGLPGDIYVDRSYLRIGFLLGVDARF